MNTNKLFTLIIIIFFALTMLGCFHDEKDKSIDISLLNGTWFGLEEDVNTGNLNKIRFTFLEGIITRVEREDQNLMMMVDLGLIGTLTANTANIWTYTLSDDTVGGLYVDDSATHLAFLDDKFNFGVIELGAVENTARVYLDDDVAASWTGFSVNVQNGSMIAIENFSSSVVVDAGTLDFVGTDTAQSVTGGNFTNSLSLNDAMLGRYVGNWTNPLIIDTPPSGSMVSYMSADKTFLATRLCLSFTPPTGNGVPDPQLCTFSAWGK